jgi:eukaryotic-like serine/threonine-protein kinase
MPLAPGTTIGRHEIVGAIGAGGMGEVYRARDSKLQRDVAIKMLPASFAGDPDRRARFEREAQAIAALSHPNVLSVHDTGLHDGQLFIVTELLEGETLAERLKSGVLPVRKGLDIAVQVAMGLAAAHDKQIVHRDLKPENLFLLRDNRVKILDFGLARHTPSVSGASQTISVVTDPGVTMGTVGYMAPEQVRGQAVDARTDLFAFGAVLYEMVSGRRAFRRETAAETMTAILRDDRPRRRSPKRTCRRRSTGSSGTASKRSPRSDSRAHATSPSRSRRCPDRRHRRERRREWSGPANPPAVRPGGTRPSSVSWLPWRSP